jgi:hypothetical protein
VGRDAGVALAIAVLAPACGLTADFSNLTGGTKDSGLVDAGVTDAPPTEASGNDGGFCASLPTPVRFCDDFDEGQAIGAGWDVVDVTAGSTAAVDYTFYSQPASFYSEIEGNGQESARLQKDLPLNTPHVHIEFEMLVPVAQGTLELCVVHQPVAQGTTYGVFYRLVNGNLELVVSAQDEDGGTSGAKTTIGPPPSSWLDVEIDADLSSSATVVVKQAGVVVANLPNVNTLTPARASMFVELGYYSFDTASTLGHFDNVVIDWQ